MTDEVPALVKIDLEGYEHRVLRGMEGLLRREVLRGLAIEVHPPFIARLGDDPGALLRTLRELGFRLAWAPRVAKEEIELREVTEAYLALPCFNLFATRP